MTKWDSTAKCTSIGLSNNSLTANWTSAGTVRTNNPISVNSKVYWELKIDINGIVMIGVIDDNFTPFSARYLCYMSTGKQRGYCSWNGNRVEDKQTVNVSYGATYTIGDVIGVAVDRITNSITFYKNGVSQGVAFTDLNQMTNIYPAVSFDGTGQVTANFGITPFQNNIPDGYTRYDAIIQKLSLVKQNDKLYNVNYNYQELGIPSDENQLNLWHNIYGLDNIDAITKTQSIKKVPLIKDASSGVWSGELDANDMSGNIQSFDADDTHKIIQYDCVTPYKILDKLDNQFRIESKITIK
jgi:hypothetical protein